MGRHDGSIEVLDAGRTTSAESELVPITRPVLS